MWKWYQITIAIRGESSGYPVRLAGGNSVENGCCDNRARYLRRDVRKHFTRLETTASP